MTKDYLSSQFKRMHFSLGQHWSNRLAAVSGGKLQEQLTPKERGQLNLLARELGTRTKEAIDFALEHWAEFASTAQDAAELLSYPSEPHVGFLLKHHAVAVTMMSSCSAKGVYGSSRSAVATAQTAPTTTAKPDKVLAPSISGENDLAEMTKMADPSAASKMENIEMTTGNAHVDAISRMPIPQDGIVIPDGWFHAPELRNKRNRCEPLVLFILAEIVSRHTVREIKDADTYSWTWLREEKRRCSYAELAHRFHCHEQWAKKICHFLRDRGLITLEDRSVTETEVDGEVSHHTKSDLTFMAPIRELVEKITLPAAGLSGGTLSGSSDDPAGGELSARG